MILGRRTNLWNGLVVAGVSLVSIVVMQLLPDVDSEVVATLGASVTLFLGSVIAVLANQPPTVAEGGNVSVSTTNGEPNVSVPVYSTPTVNKGDTVTVLTADGLPNEELVA